MYHCSNVSKKTFYYVADKHHHKQAVGRRPPRYAPPLSAPVGAEAPRAAEQTAT